MVEDARSSGARRSEASKLLGLHPRTVERWRFRGGGSDLRRGPKRPPKNKLTEQERQKILSTMNSPEFRECSPNQIVPRLADRKEYLGSESTMYRILRSANLQTHRERSRSATKRHKPQELRATGPNQVWSWDITYLKSPIKGSFFYLYMVLDVWSRKIVGWSVQECESSEHASTLMAKACAEEVIDQSQLRLHMDNGSPMKGATLLATLQRLGVVPSYSRPRVSDDNPYSESLFRTLKYRPEYPCSRFASLEQATEWTAHFIHWYNAEHQHSAIRFVTPVDRHEGRDREILRSRAAVYRRAQRCHPERWSCKRRNWEPIEEVVLNPTTHPINRVA